MKKGSYLIMVTAYTELVRKNMYSAEYTKLTCYLDSPAPAFILALVRRNESSSRSIFTML